MAIYGDSQILPDNEVDFLLDLLPISKKHTPDIYIFDNWRTIVSLTGENSDLSSLYYLVRDIVRSSTFSTYNYQRGVIFIYLFNLPYKDSFQKKLHGTFCLFHEIRHHLQFMTDQSQFLTSLPNPQSSDFSYNLSWVEKDANKFAVKWMRRNRREINDKFHLSSIQWDVGVNEKNKLRILQV